MWMCHANYVPGQDGCSYFSWAEFDDDGEPPWAAKVRADAARNAEGMSTIPKP